MRITHSIATSVEGELNQVLTTTNVRQADTPTLDELLETVRQLAFVAETVAHLHGLERSILPHADKARAMIAALEPKEI